MGIPVGSVITTIVVVSSWRLIYGYRGVTVVPACIATLYQSQTSRVARVARNFDDEKERKNYNSADMFPRSLVFVDSNHNSQNLPDIYRNGGTRDPYPVFCLTSRHPVIETAFLPLLLLQTSWSSRQTFIPANSSSMTAVLHEREAVRSTGGVGGNWHEGLAERSGMC